jgi:hypothetical protein
VTAKHVERTLQRARTQRFLGLLGAVATSAALAGCGGEFVRDAKTPARLVIVALQGASGADPNQLGTTMHSDVLTLITSGGVCTKDNPCPTIFSDPGVVELRLQLRDIGNPANPASPSPLNAVTITRYHVRYVRSDGRNQQGVDVPYEFDGAATFTVPTDGSATGGFTMVRSQAKREAPLAPLVNNDTIITAIAYVTFYGRDQAGNEVSVTGTIDVSFGNFGDPA